MRIITVPEHKKVKNYNVLNEAGFDFGKIKDQKLHNGGFEDYAKELEKRLLPEVEAWLKQYNIIQYNIECTGHGIEVTVNTNLNLANYKLLSLPNFFKFKYVQGDCNLANNRFTSFKNFPEIIGGDCICTFNYIQDFSGSLPTVKGKMYAEKQRVYTKYKLNDENYRKAIAGTLNEDNLVQIISTGQYGILTGINESKGVARVLINDDISYHKQFPITDIDVINGISYLNKLRTR